MIPGLPTGYVRVTAGRCSAVALREHVDDARVMLADGTLYKAAARDLAARPFTGRGVAYAIALPLSGVRVVVRHNRHGGLLAPITRDIFLPPTRAPYELAVTLRLRTAGVLTPDIIMYGIERRLGLLCRADVVTRELIGARDLSTYMMPGVSAQARAHAWKATAGLLRALDAAGARHHDLNVKNVLLSNLDLGARAWILDVDRVRFGAPGIEAVREGNVSRLRRSARKWRDQRGGQFVDSDLIVE